jgi:hypothetical protein
MNEAQARAYAWANKVTGRSLAETNARLLAAFIRDNNCQRLIEKIAELEDIERRWKTGEAYLGE